MKLTNRFELLKGNVFYGPLPVRIRKELFLYDHLMRDWLLLLIADFPSYLITNYVPWRDDPAIALPFVILINLTAGEKIGSVPGAITGTEDYRIVESDRTLERYVVFYQELHVFEFSYKTPGDNPEKMGVRHIEDFKVYYDEDSDHLPPNDSPLSKRIKVGLPPSNIPKGGLAVLARH